MNIMHSSRSDAWMTPVPILDMVREVLGPINLDPASSAMANERVRAARFYTKEDDGLALPWFGSVFCNPPGGKLGNRSLSALFWAKLMQSRADVEHAIFLAFSAEALQTTQWPGQPSIMAFPFCVPRRRIRFDHPPPTIKIAPSHSNVIVYVPGHCDNSISFRMVFSRLGAVR